MPRKQQNKAETLARSWERLSGEHFRSFERARLLCNAVIEREFARFTEGTIDPETGKHEEYEISAAELRSYVQALAAAIAGEREALSLEYLDERRAVARVEQLGFILTLPDGTMTIDTQYQNVE